MNILKIRDNIQFGCTSCFCELSIYVQKQMKLQKKNVFCKILYLSAETELLKVKEISLKF